jgi:hypothetical protein
MVATPEHKIKQQIKAILDKYGDDIYYFMPVQTGYGRRTLDFLGCAWGIFFAIEAKRSAKAPMTMLQLATINDIQRAGGVALVIGNELGLEALRKFLEFARKGPM